MNKTQKLLFINLGIILLSSSHAWAEDTKFLAFFGKQLSSGNTVLGTVNVSREDVQKSAADHKLSYGYKTIATGVEYVAQGNNNSLLYKRPNNVWRFSNGAHRQIVDSDPYDVTKDIIESILELPVKDEQSEGLLFFLRKPNSSLVRLEDFRIGIFNYEGEYPLLAESPREILGAISPTSFLVRISKIDEVGRLTSRRLAIASVPSISSKEAVVEEPIPLIGEEFMEVASATNGRLIATQLYDNKQKMFRLAVVDSLTKELSWLPIPEKKGRTDYYKKSFEVSRVKRFYWSPDQRYLAVERYKYGTNVWDNSNKSWVMTNDSLKTFSAVGETASVPSLWISNSQLASVDLNSPIGPNIVAYSMDKPNVQPELLGAISGVSVLEIFNVNSELKSDN